MKNETCGKDYGLSKKDMERGYSDGEDKKPDIEEIWEEIMRSPQDEGGFLGRAKGWER